MNEPDQRHSEFSEPAGIPFSLRIGVTGHRTLTNPELLHDAVEEFVKDFATEASRAEFEALLARADCIRSAPATAVRSSAYLRAGKTVVQSCDVLISIWNGRTAAGSGGTAEIVQLARHVGRWMFWIHAEEGTITEEHRPDTMADTIEYLAAYNGEHLSQEQLNGGLESRYRTLQEHAQTAGLDVSYPQRVWSHLLPHLVRASRLAARYQQRHNLAVYGVTSLAVLAVAAVTIQVLLFRQLPQLVWIEVTAMVLILSLLFLSRGRQWHRKWIDYRFLAERLRAALFLATCGLECSPPKPLPHSVAHRPDDWMVKAFAWIWDGRPQLRDQPPPTIRSLKDFLLTAWIRDQAVYYARRSRQYHRAQESLTAAGYLLFGVTLVAAIIHVLAGGREPAGEAGVMASFSIAAAIILPALGAALADIRIHREYSRNAERYGHMARQLDSLARQIAGAQDMNELLPLLEEANEVMLREQQDWRVIVLFQEIEAP